MEEDDSADHIQVHRASYINLCLIGCTSSTVQWGPVHTYAALGCMKALFYTTAYCYPTLARRNLAWQAVLVLVAHRYSHGLCLRMVTVRETQEHPVVVNSVAWQEAAPATMILFV